MSPSQICVSFPLLSSPFLPHPTVTASPLLKSPGDFPVFRLILVLDFLSFTPYISSIKKALCMLLSLGLSLRKKEMKKKKQTRRIQPLYYKIFTVRMTQLYEG